MPFPVLQDIEITVVPVLEDTGLDVVIPFMGIVVQVGESLFRRFVITDILLHVGTVLVQGVADAGGECQTDTAVNLRLVAQCLDGHRLQGVDQGVVAGDIRICLV